MLSEIRYVRQVPNEPRRRWLMNDYFDLIPDGEFDRDSIQIHFLNASQNIDPETRNFIIEKPGDYRVV